MPHLLSELSSRVLPLVCAFLLTGVGCDKPTVPVEPSPQPAIKPHKKRPILNDPDGLPEPLVTAHVELWVREVGDGTASKKQVQSLGTVLPIEGEHRVLPSLRVGLNPSKGLSTEDVALLNSVRIRGHVVFWHSLVDGRQRLIDGGRAGLFRGVSWHRDAIPALEEVTDKAPMLLLAGVSSTDETMVPANGFRSPSKESPRMQSPDGALVTLLEPTSTDLMGAGIDRVVETLYGYQRRGGTGWLLIAIPFQTTGSTAKSSP